MFSTRSGVVWGLSNPPQRERPVPPKAEEKLTAISKSRASSRLPAPKQRKTTFDSRSGEDTQEASEASFQPVGATLARGTPPTAVQEKPDGNVKGEPSKNNGNRLGLFTKTSRGRATPEKHPETGAPLSQERRQKSRGGRSKGGREGICPETSGSMPSMQGVATSTPMPAHIDAITNSAQVIGDCNGCGDNASLIVCEESLSFSCDTSSEETLNSDHHSPFPILPDMAQAPPEDDDKIHVEVPMGDCTVFPEQSHQAFPPLSLAHRAMHPTPFPTTPSTPALSDASRPSPPSVNKPPLWRPTTVHRRLQMPSLLQMKPSSESQERTKRRSSRGPRLCERVASVNTSAAQSGRPWDHSSGTGPAGSQEPIDAGLAGDIPWYCDECIAAGMGRTALFVNSACAQGQCGVRAPLEERDTSGLSALCLCPNCTAGVPGTSDQSGRVQGRGSEAGYYGGLQPRRIPGEEGEKWEGGVRGVWCTSSDRERVQGQGPGLSQGQLEKTLPREGEDCQCHVEAGGTVHRQAQAKPAECIGGQNTHSQLVARCSCPECAPEITVPSASVSSEEDTSTMASAGCLCAECCGALPPEVSTTQQLLNPAPYPTVLQPAQCSCTDCASLGSNTGWQAAVADVAGISMRDSKGTELELEEMQEGEEGQCTCGCGNERKNGGMSGRFQEKVAQTECDCDECQRLGRDSSADVTGALVADTGESARAQYPSDVNMTYGSHDLVKARERCPFDQCHSEGLVIQERYQEAEGACTGLQGVPAEPQDCAEGLCTCSICLEEGAVIDEAKESQFGTEPPPLCLPPAACQSVPRGTSTRGHVFQGPCPAGMPLQAIQEESQVASEEASQFQEEDPESFELDTCQSAQEADRSCGGQFAFNPSQGSYVPSVSRPYKPGGWTAFLMQPLLLPGGIISPGLPSTALLTSLKTPPPLMGVDLPTEVLQALPSSQPPVTPTVASPVTGAPAGKLPLYKHQTLPAYHKPLLPSAPCPPVVLSAEGAGQGLSGTNDQRGSQGSGVEIPMRAPPIRGKRPVDEGTGNLQAAEVMPESDGMRTLIEYLPHAETKKPSGTLSMSEEQPVNGGIQRESLQESEDPRTAREKVCVQEGREKSWTGPPVSKRTRRNP